MLELVIVVSDLYLSRESPERELPAGVALHGLQHAARFGTAGPITGGWRSWVGRWLTGTDTGAPATVAAASQESTSSQPPSRGPTVWMATPVHLVAGLTSLHLDRRSILHLRPSDLAAFAAEFQRVFHDSGFELRPLESGAFLLFGPPVPLGETLEPARAMGASIADAQRAGVADPALRRLGAEIEMWLHDHAVNDARMRRGELPVTGLWLWGGGPVPPKSPGHCAGESLTVGETQKEFGPACDISSDIAFGNDAYLHGLWTSRGQKVFPLPEQLADVFGYPQAQRAVLVVEIGHMLQSNPTWTFFDAVAQIDRSFIAPAVDALNRGQCERLVILANDHQLALRAPDRLKFWRRSPPGLSGLQ